MFAIQARGRSKNVVNVLLQYSQTSPACTIGATVGGGRAHDIPTTCRNTRRTITTRAPLFSDCYSTSPRTFLRATPCTITKRWKPKKKSKKAQSAPARETTSAATTSMDELEDDNDDHLYSDIEDMEEEEDDGLPSLPDPQVVKDKMEQVVARFEDSLKSIRGAEPTADLFDDIQVNAYGSMTPLKAVGQVVIVSATMAQITCFDPSVAKDVSKSIQLALELNPQVVGEAGGGIVQVPLPRVSMEIREQTAKQLKKKAESCKQRLRMVRRKAMDVLKKGKDGKLEGISKDDAFATSKEIENTMESIQKSLSVIIDKKMESILEV